jgi:hypothetical protein
MTLALQSLRLMLIASALCTALMLVLWLGLNNDLAKTAAYTNGLNLAATLIFTILMPKRQTWISAAFLVFCFMLVVGSKMGGFTITTFPAYIMAILSFGGIAGTLRWISNERDAQT